jgi:hypothetical protein
VDVLDPLNEPGGFVKHMFLGNIEVTNHKVSYILRNIVTQSTLKMIDFVNVK